MAPPAQPLDGVSFGAKFASTRLFDIIVGVAKLARLTMAHPVSLQHKDSGKTQTQAVHEEVEKDGPGM